MKELLKHFRPFDYVLIALAILISFTPTIVTSIFYQEQQTPESKLVAIVKIDGEIVDELPLGEGQSQEITYYPHEGQYNIVQVEGEAIRVREDNSPDQIAVNTGWIRKPGQILVCLPHQLVIEIKQRGDTPETDESEEELILPI